MLEAYPRTPLAWHAWLPWSSWQSLERANTQSAPHVDTYVQISARDTQPLNSDHEKYLVVRTHGRKQMTEKKWHLDTLRSSRLKVLKAPPYPVGSPEPVACQETVEMLEITGHFLHHSVAQVWFFLSARRSFIRFQSPPKKKQKRGRKQKEWRSGGS